MVTAQTKSGTNNFHGSAFDYRRSNANLARNPFSQNPSPADPTRVGNLIPGGLYSEFGGSVGGPIKKDRAFFFGDYQGQRQRAGTSGTADCANYPADEYLPGHSGRSQRYPGLRLQPIRAAAGRQRRYLRPDYRSALPGQRDSDARGFRRRRWRSSSCCSRMPRTLPPMGPRAQRVWRATTPPAVRASSTPISGMFAATCRSRRRFTPLAGSAALPIR